MSALGRKTPDPAAYERAAEAGTLLAGLGITVVSVCGSPATRVAVERAIAAGGTVLSIVPPDEMPPPDWPATVVVPCGMGDARNLLMALSGDACIVIGGRAGIISEVCLAWLHKRPLLPLTGCGGWSDGLLNNPPDERKNSPILPWSSSAELKKPTSGAGFGFYWVAERVAWPVILSDDFWNRGCRESACGGFRNRCLRDCSWSTNIRSV
ncbi:Rossmann fold nucleotide-binding protein [Rhodoferax sp. PAMC 29310]|uniref:SLOG cluster 4 domain-containing protein n=1 Tax=Rhodoferax sp. PAMC 29310 TaxID=2822760 RepID=UPI001B34172E|nr:Rossmann fold nucleotide-binding protein [Rhodoferax sp. PAMC 29310]